MNEEKINEINKKINFDGLETEELWTLYGMIIGRLKELDAIRTNNMTAERGEQLAFKYYNNTKGLSNLQAAPPGTKNFDAIGKNGARYSVKTIKLPRKLTGVFWGMGSPENPITEKKFEYLIVVAINEYYQLEKIYEIDWDNFFELKKWHSTMEAFNISVTREFCNNCKIIYERD